MDTRLRIATAVLIAASTLLAACGGGGGGDGGGDSSSPARIADVEPLSEHRLRVTYDTPPGDKALDPGNYAIVDEAGNHLDVIAVAPVPTESGNTKQVILSTGAQQAAGYTLIFPVTDGEQPDPDQGMAFSGSVVQEPKLLEVEVLDLEHLRLTFDRPIGTQAEDPAFYSIFRPGQAAAVAGDTQAAGQLPAAARKATIVRTMTAEIRVSAHRRALQTATEPRDILEVINAEFGETASVVLLTTETMEEPLDFVLIVGDIRGQSGVLLDPTRNTAQFNSDVTPPRLDSVEPQGASSLLLTFSEPLGPSAEDAGNYTLSPATAIESAMLVGDDSQVILGTGPLFDEEYELTVSNIRDARNGLLIDPRARIFTFLGNGNVNEESPRVVAAVSTDNKTVIVQFSKPMGDDALAPAAYSIAPAGPDGGGVQVLAAEFTDAGRDTVALTTGAQQAIGYLVTVIGVSDLGGRPLASDNSEIDPNRAAFAGTAPPPSEDVTPPRLLSAAPQGETSLLLTFSEAVNATADEPGNYAISPATDVLGAQRLANNTQVLLETGSLFAVEYQLTASNIEDTQGLLIDPAGKTVAFIGAGAVDTDRPRVVSAISANNTTVIVGFSKPMADNAENPGSYAIVQEDVNPQVGSVAVQAAEFVDASRLEVRLTTASQNEVTYRVQVSGVTDLGGRPLQSQQPFGVDPTSAVFAGTPPTGDQLVDSDGDGVPDNVEARGYTVTVRLATGEISTRQVTGDPNSADSDNDGLDDSTEKTLVSDPRSADTDADGLTDFQEFTEIFSSATNQDSDGDGSKDGTEYSFFVTSPILADSDGDQTPDGEEVSLGGRNPRVADLPTPTLEIGEMNLALDVRFIEANSAGTTEIDSQTATSTLTQAESQEFSNSSSETLESVLKASAESTTSVTVEAKFPKGAGASATSSFTAGVEQANTSAYTTAWSESSRQATTQAYQDSLTTQEQVTEGSTLTRQVRAARISVAVTLENAGDIAFTISNIQITALIQDPEDPTSLVPVATLLPDVGADAQFNLGTLSTDVGPLIFSNDQIFPQVVESLMANPRGLVFRFSNYDITDEFGRNFAFTSQDITDRTAGLVLDFGGTDSDGDGQGDLSETFRVATGSGRRIDTDGDGDIDTDDRRVTFDSQGKQVGITLREALQAAGLEEFDEDSTPTNSLSPDQIENSYSVQQAAGDTRIFRIRNTAVNPDDTVRSEWYVVTPTGIDRDLSLDEVILEPGGGVLLAFVQDLDRDNLPALLEFANNCSDSAPDTDGDSLDDRFEALVGWEVTLGGRGSLGTRRSSCDSGDTDGDGLSDQDEAPGDITRDANGLIFVRAAEGPPPQREPLPMPAPVVCTSLPGGPDRQFCLAVESAINDPITDPTSVDTDGDGLTDAFEVQAGGYQVDPLTGPPLMVNTSPEHFDSDGDGAGDGFEVPVGGNPRLQDAAGNFGDSDADGLIDSQEGVFRTVQYEQVSGSDDLSVICPVTGCAPGAVTNLSLISSSPTNPDTDGDGLTDFREFQLGTAPADYTFVRNSVFVTGDGTDTDRDGLTDFEEVNGFATAGTGDFGILFTDPLDADTDDDQRLDGAEVGRVTPDTVLAMSDAGRSHIVAVPGEAPFRSYTHPLVADADFDQLVDGDEVQFGGDPANFNTDGHHLADRAEAVRGSRVDVPDYLVTMEFTNFRVIKSGHALSGSFVGVGVWFLDLTVRGPTESGTLVSADFESFRECDSIPLALSTTTPCDAPEEEFVLFFNEESAELDKRIALGAVSTTADRFEQIRIEDEIGTLFDDPDTLDRSDENCVVDFPIPATGIGNADGIFPGPELDLGNMSFAFTGTAVGDRFHVECEFTLSGVLEVR